MSTTPETSQRSPIGTWLTIAGCAIFILVWLFVLRPNGKLQQPTKEPGVGQPLMTMELQPLTGDPPGISLENLRGRVTMINYWGTWCPPCVAEFPRMVEIWDELRGNPNFQFLSVSSSGRPREDVEAVRTATQSFLKLRDAAIPTYIDADGVSRQTLTAQMGAQYFAFPTTVLLDRQGIIRAIWVGYEPGTERQMREIASQLLAESSKVD
jgi:thiol-disulfide isomerase/thioredoxin